MRRARLSFLRLAVVSLVCGVLLLAVTAGAGASSNASRQVVFSGVAFQNSTFSRGSPAGFWIWCEGSSSNPYNGECYGAMYFYALGITGGVAGTFNWATSTMTVSSDGPTNISCTLTGPSTPTHGPTNTVAVSCSSPSGSATSPNAVVNVTGP